MKDFRTFTHAIPLTEKTTVVFNDEGFANTVEDKIAMAHEYDNLFIAWPGEYETHVFEATGEQILEVLVPEPAFKVGDPVRVTKVLGRVEIGMVGVVRVVDGEVFGVELAGYRHGHNLGGAINNSRGYWLYATHLEAA